MAPQSYTIDIKDMPFSCRKLIVGLQDIGQEAMKLHVIQLWHHIISCRTAYNANADDDGDNI